MWFSGYCVRCLFIFPSSISQSRFASRIHVPTTLQLILRSTASRWNPQNIAKKKIHFPLFHLIRSFVFAPNFSLFQHLEYLKKPVFTACGCFSWKRVGARMWNAISLQMGRVSATISLRSSFWALRVRPTFSALRPCRDGDAATSASNKLLGNQLDICVLSERSLHDGCEIC